MSQDSFGNMYYMSGVDEYMKQATPSQKEVFERFRKIVNDIVPDAEEVISYGIPTFKYQKKPLVYFGVFKDHMSIYPASDAMVEELGKDLGRFRASKGTLRFTEDKPIAESLLRGIIKHRLNSVTKS